jgi:ubiquinone/menaquinone biosynthesis C-methylase UbiE
MLALKVILIVLGALLLGAGLMRLIKRLYHFPAPVYIGIFLDSKLRRWMQPTPQLISRSGIKAGMKVLDLGCGSGAFTTVIARTVGDRGKVYAVDMQPAMLKQLKRKLAKTENRDIDNIEIKQSGAYDLPLEDNTLDAVVMVATLQEIPDRGRALREVRRVLKPGGILAISEFFIDTDYPRRTTTIRVCQQEGFVLDTSLGNFWNYTVRFRKASAKSRAS